ncbi:MAG: hypothetical protein CEE40_00675 [Chloroflexi bacterium B3_Chlor]|nr:MAG: hypothetical protein CEE40_00675 [Chloroflexi bacterium B3_Chlor]
MARVTTQRLNQLEVACLLIATPFLLFPSVLSVAALLILLAPWLLRWRARGRPTVRTPMDIPILCMLLMVPVAVWSSALPQESLRKLLGIILGVAFFYGVANTGQTRGWIWCWTLVLVSIGVGISCLSLFGTDWASYKMLPLQPIYQRLPRLFHNVTTYGGGGFHPNEVGGALALLVPVSLSACLALRSRNPGSTATDILALGADRWEGSTKRWVRPLLSRRTMLLLAALAFALTAGVFILTQSRSAYVGMAVGLIAFGVSRSRWFLVALLVVAVMASVLVWSVGVEGVIDSFLPVESGRIAVGRLEIWRRAAYLMQDFPYTGVGLNMFPYVGDAMYPYPSQGLSARVPHAHNNFLQVAVDLGIPGLIAYLALLVAFCACAWRIYRHSQSRPLRLLTAGLFSGMLAHQVYGLTDAITLGAKPGFVLWIILGMVAAVYHLEVDQRGPLITAKTEKTSRLVPSSHA